MADLHMLFRRVLFAALLVFSPFCLADERTLLVLGDSLSSAYRMHAWETWPALLEKRLLQSGTPMRVINASRKGETANGGRERLQGVLDQHRPNIVILALGANDGLRKQPLDRLTYNLSEMVRMVRKSGGTPVLVGMKLPPSFERTYAEGFSRVFEQVAADTQTPFVPFLLLHVVGDPDLFFPDRRHPRAEAQPRLLDVVWPVLDATLKSSNTLGLAVQR